MALATEEHPKRETVSDLYGNVFTELWTVHKREETNDEKKMEGTEQVRSSYCRFDPQGLLEIPAQEREAIQRLTLIVHYYSDVKDALRTVTDASFEVQFEDLFYLKPKTSKKENGVKQTNGYERDFDVFPTGPLRALAPTQVVLKSFKPTALLTLVQALPSITHLQLVILSKSPFSVSQAEFMRDYLRFVGPNLVGLQMWIHAMHDRNAQDEVVSNLDRVWPVLDLEMPKLQHLTLEVQQNLGGPKVRTHTPKLDNIMTRLREFRFGSMDGSTNLDRTLDHLGQDKTISFVYGEYSQFFNETFLTIVKSDYWPRLVQMGLFIDSNALICKTVKDHCAHMKTPVQLHFDLSKMKGDEFKILGSIPKISLATIQSLRFRYNLEQHIWVWYRDRETGLLSLPKRIYPNIVSLQLDVINVDCQTFDDVKEEGKFPNLKVISKFLTKLRGLVIYFDNCISDYYELPGCGEDDESKEETEKDKKRKMFRKQAKMHTHQEYYETYASYLLEAGVLSNKLLLAVRIKFGAKRTLEFTREQLVDERAKQKDSIKQNSTDQ